MNAFAEITQLREHMAISVLVEFQNCCVVQSCHSEWHFAREHGLKTRLAGVRQDITPLLLLLLLLLLQNEGPPWQWLHSHAKCLV